VAASCIKLVRRILVGEIQMTTDTTHITKEALLQALDIAESHGRNHFYKKWILDKAEELAEDARAAELNAQKSKPVAWRYKHHFSISKWTYQETEPVRRENDVCEPLSVSAQDASPKDGWQPIATAPKDGSAIFAFWAFKNSWQKTIDGRNYAVVWFVDGEWRPADEFDDDAWCEPDFWKPLPEPPK
jgi:hypothetical protein